jgi:hypothetical protein
VSGWLIFLLCIAGHAECWVILINRLHALPIRHTLLRRLRTLHDLAIPTFPFLLAALAGFGPNGLLNSGNYTQLPQLTRILLACSLAGCLPLVAGIFRWQFTGRKCFRHSSSSQHLNLLNDYPAQYSLDTLVGIPRRLARLWPWNEILQLELNHKLVRIPRRKPSHATNRTPSRILHILHLSDLHFTGTPGLDFYRRAVQLAAQHPADAIMFTGDLIDDPRLLPAAVEILRPLTRIAPCWFILGNHDWRYDHEHIRKSLEESGWKSVAGRQFSVELNGLSLLIAGSERPWMSDPPPSAKDQTADLRILLCHTPDGLSRARNLGYQLMLSGHTHGGQVVLPFVGPVYSPSLHGVKYASGLFQLPKITLHVSRGLGSKDPLRWNCTPELTWLQIEIPN